MPGRSRYAHRLIALVQIPRLFTRTQILSGYSWSPMSARITTSYVATAARISERSSTSPTNRLRNYAADSVHTLLASRKTCLERQISKPLYQRHFASYRTPRNRSMQIIGTVSRLVDHVHNQDVLPQMGGITARNPSSSITTLPSNCKEPHIYLLARPAGHRSWHRSRTHHRHYY